MSDIWVNCSHCGQVFAASDELTSKSIACPQCGKQIAVIASGIRSESAAKLKVKHDNTITGGKRCPYCEATMAAEAVICLRCGYDTRTGLRHLDNSPKSRMLQWILWGFGLIILAGLVKTLLLQDQTRERQRTRQPVVKKPPMVVASAAPAVTNEVVVTNETRTTNETMVPDTSEVAQPVIEVQTALTPVVASADENPLDLAKNEADYRLKLNQQLEATYPMYTPGDAVVLRRRNGLIHRGTLVSLTPNAVVVVGSGQTNEIPLKVLDRPSRLKCDATFRAQIVEFHVQKRVKELSDF